MFLRTLDYVLVIFTWEACKFAARLIMRFV